MKLSIALALFVIFSFVSQPGFSQKEIVVNGNKYVLHTVVKSETIFNLCQTYKITTEELRTANPGMDAILKAGSVIKIPVGKVVGTPQKTDATERKTSEGVFYYHKVARKQTIFSISKQYGITANDLIRNNPEASNGLTIGQILKIPVNNSEDVSQPATSEVAKTGGTSGFKIHSVVSGETLFGLEKSYGIGHEEMLKWNPDLQNGLKTGMKLKIPSKMAVPVENTPEQNSVYSKYQVAKGETLFSLAARFGVDVGELKKTNPDLYSRSLETGETILIPQHTIVSNTDERGVEINQGQYKIADIPESAPAAPCLTKEGAKFKKYKVALLLPFYLSEVNNSDLSGADKSMLTSPIVFNNKPVPLSSDTTMIANGTKTDPRAAVFLEFYEGAVLAVDSMQRAGMNVVLYVFDASNQNQVNDLIQMDEFRDLSLIIGPVYPELQELVASFAAKNRIPMISPLSSAGNFEQNNSWYFKVNSTKDFQINQTASYIANEFSNNNFFLLQQNGSSGADEARLANLCKEKLSRKSGRNYFHEYSFLQQGANNIEPLLSKEHENVFLIPTDNEAQVSVAVTNLNALAENYNIVLMGTPSQPKMKSIQTENYHRVRLRFLSPYFVDYNKPLVRRIVSQYRGIFSGEPSPYSFQGFDVSFYFLSALFQYGKDFRSCIPNYPMELTQMDFNFRKVTQMGGYMNEGLFITAYERNYDILNYGIYLGQKPK